MGLFGELEFIGKSFTVRKNLYNPKMYEKI